MEYTEVTMKQRLSVLEGIEQKHELSLREAGELDAIRNYGLDVWRQYRRKHYARG